MDQSSFQAVTKLEQRLELMKKQRKKLKHELGESRSLENMRQKIIRHFTRF